MNTNQEYLIRHGWRLYGKKWIGHSFAQLWDHPNHQTMRGGFTQNDALQHQRDYGKGGCDCTVTQPEESGQ